MLGVEGSIAEGERAGRTVASFLCFSQGSPVCVSFVSSFCLCFHEFKAEEMFLKYHAQMGSRGYKLPINSSIQALWLDFVIVSACSFLHCQFLGPKHLIVKEVNINICCPYILCILCDYLTHSLP